MKIRKSSIVVASFTLLIMGAGSYHMYSSNNNYVVTPNVVEAGLSGDASSISSNTQVQSVLLKTFTEKIHSSLPEYTFRVYGHEDNQRVGNYCVSKILIVKPGDNEEIIQEITFSDTFTPDKRNFGIHIEDLNFDGYKDLRIQEFLPAGPNIPYFYWTFDLEQKKYVPNHELEMILSPIVDHKNKMITSKTRSSASTYEKSFYQYIDGHITQIKMIQMQIDPQNQVTHITVKELKNGTMVEIKYDKPFPMVSFEEIE